jgi:hypothetical protein
MNFFDTLENEGITRSTINVLDDELINNWTIFNSMGESHFDKLLPLVKVGQHALLFSMWKK